MAGWLSRPAGTTSGCACACRGRCFRMKCHSRTCKKHAAWMQRSGRVTVDQCPIPATISPTITRRGRATVRSVQTASCCTRGLARTEACLERPQHSDVLAFRPSATDVLVGRIGRRGRQIKSGRKLCKQVSAHVRRRRMRISPRGGPSRGSNDGVGERLRTVAVYALQACSSRLIAIVRTTDAMTLIRQPDVFQCGRICRHSFAGTQFRSLRSLHAQK